jgi:hypothetical protein
MKIKTNESYWNYLSIKKIVLSSTKKITYKISISDCGVVQSQNFSVCSLKKLKKYIDKEILKTEKKNENKN